MVTRFRNLKAEQARNGYTNEQMGQIMGMSRGNYETKLRNGRFYASEALLLCKLFDCDFMYLFAEESDAVKMQKSEAEKEAG